MKNYKEATLKELASDLESWASRLFELEDEDLKYRATKSGKIREYSHNKVQQDLDVKDAVLLLNEYGERSDDLEDDIDLAKLENGKLYLFDFENYDNHKTAEKDMRDQLWKFVCDTLGLEFDNLMSFNFYTDDSETTEIPCELIITEDGSNFLVTEDDVDTLDTVYFKKGDWSNILSDYTPYTKEELIKLYHEDDDIGPAAKALLNR